MNKRKSFVRELILVVGLFFLSAPIALAQPCEGNFDCDQDVDGTDAAVFKADFGRSSFNRPCTPPDPCVGDFDGVEMLTGRMPQCSKQILAGAGLIIPVLCVVHQLKARVLLPKSVALDVVVNSQIVIPA